MSDNDNRIFLIDTSSVVNPYQMYYAFDLVPVYWDILKEMIENKRVVMLDMVHSEINVGDDSLSKWLKALNNVSVISRQDSLTISYYQEVIRYISESGLYKPEALTEWARTTVADPWLIASAKANGYTIVTEESRSGGLSIKNPNKYAKIPDVAIHFGVSTINLFEMMRALKILIK